MWLIPCTLIGFEEGPVGQTVVYGNDDRVFEEFRGNHQEDHEEATGGQVTPTHLQDDENASENNWNTTKLHMRLSRRFTLHGIFDPLMVVVDMLSSSSSSSSPSVQSQNLNTHKTFYLFKN